jgi:XisH protein
MPAKDSYHNTVVQALITDGWEITDDPFILSYLMEVENSMLI